MLETEWLRLDILGLNEVKWTGRKKIEKDKYNFTYSNVETHEPEVHVLIGKKLSKLISDVSSVSDGVVSVKINLQQRVLTIIQVYAPKIETNDEEIEEFYRILSETV